LHGQGIEAYFRYFRAEILRYATGMNNQPCIYLASQSPRRRELLHQIGVKFETLLLRNDARRIVGVDETPLPAENPLAYVQRISLAKAEAAWEAILLRNLRKMPVLAADTTVTFDNLIIGKPRDREEAFLMLRQLSGREHLVHTAVAVKLNERTESRLSTTEVTFAELSEERIRRYVAGAEAHDKAGAYGIQGFAGAFVQRIAGSYSGVVGLPLFETTQLLNFFGCQTP
jgi:septum formation protein